MDVDMVTGEVFPTCVGVNRADLQGADLQGVFPTCVGVNLLLHQDRTFTQRIPHVCGGEPFGVGQDKAILPYSPRVWG